MNKIFTTILISAITMSFTGLVSATTAEGKATYKAAKESADADYKIAHEKCNSLSGNPKDVCVAEADAVRTRSKSEAEAGYKNTARARANARIAIASADHDVAKAKCGSQAGNEKDVCLKEAKAAYVVAKADAKSDKKVSMARADARDDKNDANYKVALEKCDALVGAAKDTCVSSAKTQFNK